MPWKDDLFWVGSSYEWSFTDSLPTESFKEKMIAALDAILKIPYEVVDHLVGIRPANTMAWVQRAAHLPPILRNNL